MNQTHVFIVSAPSGSGKTTLIDRLREAVPELVFSVSYTTRERRGQEQNGREYYFVSRDEFQGMVERGELLEWAEVYGGYFYGTPRRFLDEAVELGWDLLLDIDVLGHEQVKKQFGERAVSVFIAPPSRPELEKRLRLRGLDSEQMIGRRLARAAREIQDYWKYDYTVINDDVERASERLNSIVLAERWRRRGDGRAAETDLARWQEVAKSCRQEAVRAHMEPILKTFGM